MITVTESPTKRLAPSSATDERPPRVSVVLPVRNEAEHIEACLERLLEQEYPAEALEVLVVDGRSDDETRDVVRGVQRRYPGAALRLLDNQGVTVAPGLNAGIRAATGDVIVRMDGHTVPAPDYIARCVAALRDSGAANVGGVIEPLGTTAFGQAVAIASTHRLGAGDARYRVGGTAGDVDTVPFGAFRRDVFTRVGLFDESLVRNQDYELNVRIREAGERVYLDPAIRSVYTPRSTVRSLWAQYFQYGWWKVETLRRHPRSLRVRQLMPPAFLLVLALAVVAAPWSVFATGALAAMLAAYAIVVGTVALRVAPPRAQAHQVALAFAVIHFGFSLGFLLNVMTAGRYPYRAQPPAVPRLDALDDLRVSEATA